MGAPARRNDVSKIGQTLSLAALALVLQLAPARAQTPDASKTGPVTARPDRTTADPATRKKMMERQAAARKKRNACIAERRAKKIPLRQHNKFIRDCMAR
jgi:hypothetical protein